MPPLVNPSGYLPPEFERKFEAKNRPRISFSRPDHSRRMGHLDVIAGSYERESLFRPAATAMCTAVTADTGVELWKVQTKDVVHASPAVFNNTVYIGSWDSYLYALNGETGEEKWTFKAGEDNTIHNQVGFQSSPAVVDGVVYVDAATATSMRSTP